MAIEVHDTAAPDRQTVEVLLAGADTDSLVDLVDRIDSDSRGVSVTTETDPDEVVTLLEEEWVDCLVATYNPSADEGLDLLDYLREHPVEIPVVLVPSDPVAVVDSQNLVVDISSVFMREEAIQRETLAPDLVDTVERRRAAAEADRRSQMETALKQVARDLAEADTEEEVLSTLAARFEETPTIDAAWIAEYVDDELAIHATANGDPDAAPPTLNGEDPAGAAVDRALAVGRPQVAVGNTHAYAAVPVEPSESNQHAVTLASESPYAFGEDETRVLSELGATVERSIDDLQTGGTLSLGPDERVAVEGMLQRLPVPVVAYGSAGWITVANEAFAELVETPMAELSGCPVWDVLPEPRLETFDDFWESFASGDTRTQSVEIGDDAVPRQIVTTRVEAGDEEHNVALVVAPSDRDEDPWFDEVLAYEVRHWLAIGREAVANAGDDESADAIVQSVAERMRSAVASEVAERRRGPDRASAAGSVSGEAGDVAISDDPAEAAADVSVSTEPAGKATADGSAGGGATVARVDPDSIPGETYPVSEIARDAWRQVVGLAGATRVQGNTEIVADAALLHRLFAHLFRTLLKYGEAEAVDVGILEDGFFVEDDGSGVAHADRDYVSEGATMTDAKSGASVRVARRLADRQGWELSISANDDDGTRFEVTGATVFQPDG